MEGFLGVVFEVLLRRRPDIPCALAPLVRVPLRRAKGTVPPAAVLPLAPPEGGGKIAALLPREGEC